MENKCSAKVQPSSVTPCTKEYKLEAIDSSSMKKEMLISYSDLEVMGILPEMFPQLMATIQCNNMKSGEVKDSRPNPGKFQRCP